MAPGRADQLFPSRTPSGCFADCSETFPTGSQQGKGDLLARAIERRYLDFSSERGDREAHRHFAVQIVMVALEYRMRLDLNLHVEVSGGSAVDAGFAFARESDAIAVVHTRRILTESVFCFFTRALRDRSGRAQE